MTPKKTFLFAGDANIDYMLTGLQSEPQSGREVFCDRFTINLGGSTAICAAAFARISAGLPSDAPVLWSELGDDDNGQKVQGFLEEAGVDTSFMVARQGAATGVTVNLVDRKGRTQITARGSLALIDPANVLPILDLPDQWMHFHVSGPYGMPNFPPGLSRLFRRAKEQGMSTSLDTQWDPSESWEGLNDCRPWLDFLFVNEDEANSICQSENWQTKEQQLTAIAQQALIKLGAQGVFTGGKLYPGYAVEALDTTGAGDTFAAGFLFAHLVQGQGIAEAVAFAQAAAALACTWEGGINSGLSLQRIIAIVQKGSVS